MAAKQRILRLRRVDEQGKDIKDAVCLLSASQIGSNPLDLKLLGTEGEEAFVVEAKHTALGKFKASDFSGPAPAWEAVLLYTISPRGSDPREADKTRNGKYAEWFEDLELVCTMSKVRKTSQLELIWRQGGSNKNKTKTLGKIILPSTEEEEIALFDWTAESIAAQSLQKESLTSVIDARDDRIKELESQLENLVEAKRKNEEDMLEKFCLLLNEKKAKIRELQIILADGASGQIREVTNENVAQSKTTAKRKQAASKPTTEVIETDSESDSAFESAPVGTPSRQSSDDEDVPISKVKGVIGGKAKGKKLSPKKPEPEKEEPPKRKAVKGVIGKGKAKGKATEIVKAKATRKSQDDEDDESSDGFEDEPPAARTRGKDHSVEQDDAMDVDTRQDKQEMGVQESKLPPPRRDLPFNKKSGPEVDKPLQKKAEPEQMEDSETDDEL